MKTKVYIYYSKDYRTKPKYPQYHQNLQYPQTPQYPQKYFDQGVHHHEVLVDLVHLLEGDKMQIFLKLDLCDANEVDIRNQRPRLLRN